MYSLYLLHINVRHDHSEIVVLSQGRQYLGVLGGFSVKKKVNPADLVASAECVFMMHPAF